MPTEVFEPDMGLIQARHGCVAQGMQRPLWQRTSTLEKDLPISAIKRPSPATTGNDHRLHLQDPQTDGSLLQTLSSCLSTQSSAKIWRHKAGG